MKNFKEYLKEMLPEKVFTKMADKIEKEAKQSKAKNYDDVVKIAKKYIKDQGDVEEVSMLVAKTLNID